MALQGHDSNRWHWAHHKYLIPRVHITECLLWVFNHLWQSSRPASFSPVGLTLWPGWLEHWLATLSGLSVQVRIPVGVSVAGHYIGGSSAGLGKAQHIDSSLRADWLSCFSLAWWEWRVARQGWLVPLRKWGMWQSNQPASFLPAGLNLWPELVRALARDSEWAISQYQWGCQWRDITHRYNGISHYLVADSDKVYN